MTDPDILAQRKLDEARELNAAAEKKLADAAYKLGQSEHRLRTVEAIERSVAERERALKQAGEPEFLAREKAAHKALADAQQLMKAYNADRHGAMISLQQINEREKREQSAAA